MDRNNRTKKLPGFYIALCCCVIAIGAAGFFIQNEEDSQSTTALTVAEESELPYVSVPTTFSPETYAAVSEPTEAPTEAAAAETEQSDESLAETPTGPAEGTYAEGTQNYDYSYDNPDLEPASVIVQAEESGALSDPLPDMTVLYGFSSGTLMYNDVLGDWRTHNGVDLAADTGCSVSAAAGGTVTAAGMSTYGNSVTIDHGNGLVTVYSQLGEINVSQGDTVASGDVIGTVGESVGETTREPHLHFEVYRDGTPIDPEEV